MREGKGERRQNEGVTLINMREISGNNTAKHPIKVLEIQKESERKQSENVKWKAREN